MKATIRLFKAVEIKNKNTATASSAILKKTVKREFLFSPEVVSNYTEAELVNLTNIVEKEIGLTPEQMNNTFHKSWQKIRDESIGKLITEQLVHYLTTYGFEALGVYDENSVYIPCEALNIPRIKADKIPLTIIKGYTKEEFKEKLLKLLGSGIALHEDTIRDVIDVSIFVELDEKELSKTKNKEVKAALYDYMNIVPRNPAEFLRHIVYKSTGSTLLIKNKVTTETIHGKDNLDVLGMIIKYENQYGLEGLAKIFLRFKPIFLAFKTNYKLNSYINKIRKLADRYHKPMKPDYLNDITGVIKKGERIDKVKLERELDRVSVFRKIRLAYALNYRTERNESILYRIRNGKGYAKGFSFDYQEHAQEILDTVLDSITKDVRKNVKGKKIYIPDNVKYALPATEKQFTGDFPSGTCVIVPKEMLVGVHWENIKGNRIDLDLSMISDTMKLGWDGSYRSESRSVLFSGDVTNAPRPKGATELFYVKGGDLFDMIVFVNFYNYRRMNTGKVEVPFKMLVAHQHVSEMKHNHVVNPNNVIAVAKTNINRFQKVLGLMCSTGTECRFYFAETYLGNTITSYGSTFSEHGRRYLTDFYKNTICLNYILTKAGGVITSNKEDCDIDLSLETMEKNKIINLLV